MEYRVLGPLEVAGESGPVALGGPKQRSVLAHLLLTPNELVATDTLIDAVWDGAPPAAARGTLQAYVSNLRKALGPARIEGRTGGYVLHVDPVEVDSNRFEQLVHDARKRAGDPQRSSALLHQALGLWRGAPFGDLADEEMLRLEGVRLEELRMQALEERLVVDLEVGAHNELVGELEGLVRTHPLRERLWAHLMLALYRAGRQGEALETFMRMRQVLAEQLGIDPSPELRALHERILRQDETLEVRGRPLRGYRLLERLGEGTFGVVFRARQPQLDRHVAVKVIHPRLASDVEFVRRFEREARLIARLEHPHIAPLYDYWRDADGAYLVTRLLRGSLQHAIRESGALSVDAAARVVEQIALALVAAHRQGVVHGNIKPGNVLLDEDGTAYVADFGIATDLLIARVTAAGSLTPLHLSPEQRRGELATPSSDIFGLATLVREMLSGAEPPPNGRPRSLPTAGPGSSPGVDDVLARATAEDPEDRFEDVSSFWSAFRSALGEQVVAPVLVAAGDIHNPYKGLRAFEEADAQDLFGRDKPVADMVARLKESSADARLLVVVGPSGSGKSSQVAAGLLPKLRQGVVSGSDRWFYAAMTPGVDPVGELALALDAVAVQPITGTADLRGDGGLVRAVTSILPGDGSELLLVIDQLEELFTITPDEQSRSDFLSALTAAVLEPDSPLRVVAILRADFYDRPLQHPRFGPLLARRTEAVAPFSPEELEQVISKPASRVGRQVDAALVAEMIGDVAREPAALPLLQYALTEVFEHRSDGAMTLEAYREIGGMSGAVARRAEELFAELDGEGKEACRQIFLRLVTLGEGSEDTRRRVLRSELDALEIRREAVEAVLDGFGRARLLSFDRDPTTRGPSIEAAHEALLRVWARLRGWVEDARDDVRTHRRILAAAEEWESSARDESFLLRGTRLQDLSRWATETRVAPGHLEREYLAASVEHHEADEASERSRKERERALERRSLGRLRALVAVLTVAALIGGVLTIVATDQRNRAERARMETRARELAVAADASAEVDPVLSLLLALEAVDTTRRMDGTVVREAEEALHRAILASRERLVIPSAGGFVDASPDGRTIVTQGATGGVVVRDVTGGEELVSLQGAEGVTSAAFSPDGRRILTAHAQGGITLWDGVSGDRLAAIDPQGAATMSALFDPDGNRILTIGVDGRVRLLDAGTLRVIGRMKAFAERGVAPDLNVAELASFSADGKRLAIVNPCCPVGDASVHVWDVSDRRPHVVLTLLGAWQHDVDFSPDGSMLATAGSDVRVWDSETGALLTTLPVPSGNVHDVEFDEEGTRLVASDIAGAVRVWGIEDATLSVRELVSLPGHSGPVHEVAFVPGTELIATAGTDQTTRFWDASMGGSREQLTLPGTPQWNGDVEFGQDGRTLIASSEVDGVVGIWDALTGERLRSLTGHELGAGTFGIDVSPDGSMIATASGDKTVKVWDAATGREFYTYEGHAACAGGLNACPVWDVEFSPDGSLLATAGGDGTGRILEARTGTELRALSGHEDFVTEVAFSPDGRRLATSSWDGTARLWDVDTGQTQLVLENPSEPSQIQSVAFSPDGTRVATGGWDGRVRVWDSRTGNLITTWSAGTEGSFDVVYSPDGSTIATPNALWDAETGRLRMRLPGTAVRVAFNPAGSRLATTDPPPGSLIRVWILPLKDVIAMAETRLTRGFTPEQCQTHRIDPCIDPFDA